MKNPKETPLWKSLCLTLAVALALVAVVGPIFGSAEEVIEPAVDPTQPESVYTLANPIPDIADAVRPAVVQIIAIQETWYQRSGEVIENEAGYGSGVYIDDRGYILTNNHVIEDADKVEIIWLDGTRMDAEIVGGDSGTDVAIIKFEGSVSAKPVPLGDSDALRIGELCVAIGNPGTSSTVLFGTVTSGIISGLERTEINAGNFARSVSVIQMTAAINTGNSGGALLNGKGELIGIPTLKLMASYSTIYEGMNFAIPINTAKPIVTELIETGKITRPRMGVSIATNYGPDTAMRRQAPAGVIIKAIELGSPAEEAELQINDVITHVDGERVRTTSALQAVIDKHIAGDVLKLSIARYYDESGNALSKPSTFDVELTLRNLD